MLLGWNKLAGARGNICTGIPPDVPLFEKHWIGYWLAMIAVVLHNSYLESTYYINIARL